jgi:transcription initiation factor TFIID subunit 11
MSITSATSAHPLRQTSFPPDESEGQAFSPTYRRSPSVDNMSLVSGSQVSGVPPKKKRGRKSKAERAREAADEAARGGTPGAAGGGAASVVSNGSGAPKGAVDDDADGGRDDGAGAFEVPENMASQSAARSKEQIKEEERLRALVKQQMDDDQFHRYEVWHQSKIQIGNVRKVARPPDI